MTKLLEKFLKANPLFVSTLSEVGNILTRSGHRWVLIGAWARILNLNHQILSSDRSTQDFDFIVLVKNWTAFDEIAKKMSLAKYEQLRKEPYRFKRENLKVDILPVGKEILHEGKLKWPGHEIELNFLGAEESFNMTRKVKISPKLEIEFVDVPGLVLLKMSSYLDQPLGRTRDLEDIFFCFKHYGSADLRMELAELKIKGQSLRFEHAGAYIIGREIKKAVPNPAVSKLIEVFCQAFSDAESPVVLNTASLLGNFLPVADKGEEIVSQVCAFKEGNQEAAAVFNP